MPRRPPALPKLAPILIAAVLAILPAEAKSEVQKQMAFGAEMAGAGNWREAIFRWQRALVLAPDNPRLHNDLAVAYESLGEYDKADAEYKAALASPGAPGEIHQNYEMFSKFYVAWKSHGKEPPMEKEEAREAPKEPDGGGGPK